MSAEERIAALERLVLAQSAEIAELREAAKKKVSPRKVAEPAGAPKTIVKDYSQIPKGAELIHIVGRVKEAPIERCVAIFHDSKNIVTPAGVKYGSINAWATENLFRNLEKLGRKKANLNVFDKGARIFFVKGGVEIALHTIQTITREAPSGGGGGGAPVMAEEEAEGEEEEAEEEDAEAEDEDAEAVNYDDFDIGGKVFLVNDATLEVFEKTPSGEPGAKVGKLTDTDKVEWVWNNKKIDGTFYRINAIGWVKATGSGEWVGILSATGELVKGAAPENF
jgi:hypothetical protein